MHLDVRDLRSFYNRTRLGRAAKSSVRAGVQDFWPVKSLDGQTFVGFGYALPVMRDYISSSRRSIALMPGQQGVLPWPAADRNISVLCEEIERRELDI